ncbi:MAG: aquaporin, partial [Cytophagales bacterium]|nr:aquaporin [Armatimonadota bacterium]
RFPRSQVLPYILAQLTGGIAAAAVVALLFGPGFGAHIPAGEDALRAVGIETLLTFLLMLVIMAVATDRRVGGTIPGLAIGLTVVLDVLIGGPVSGGSMNPARSLGPALFAGGAALSNYWIYIVGPVLGAISAARLFEAMRLDLQSAKNAPDSLARL